MLHSQKKAVPWGRVEVQNKKELHVFGDNFKGKDNPLEQLFFKLFFTNSGI